LSAFTCLNKRLEIRFTLLQVCDKRRPRRRERLPAGAVDNDLTAIVDSDDQGRSSPVSAQAVVVGGPAGWAVTDTSRRRRRNTAEEDSSTGRRQMSPPLRQHRSRAAWPDDVVPLTKSDYADDDDVIVESSPSTRHSGPTCDYSGSASPSVDDTSLLTNSALEALAH